MEFYRYRIGEIIMVSKVLQDAVSKRDLIAARSAFYTIILLDPSFTKRKFNEALQYV